MVLLNIIDWFKNIFDGLENTMGSFRDWLIANNRNPFLWFGFFFLGLIIFKIVYDALGKEK